MSTFLAFGDSLTQGYHDSAGGWFPRLSKLLAAYRPEGHAVFNLGISGDTVSGVLQRFSGEFGARASEEDSVVLLAIGINDSQVNLATDQYVTTPETFSEKYAELLSLATRSAEHVLAIGLTPVDEPRVKPIPWHPTRAYTSAGVSLFNGLIKAEARRQRISFLDMMSVFSRLDTRTFLSDGVHLTDAGHKEYARSVFQVLHAAKLT